MDYVNKISKRSIEIGEAFNRAESELRRLRAYASLYGSRDIQETELADELADELAAALAVALVSPCGCGRYNRARSKFNAGARDLLAKYRGRRPGAGAGEE